MTGLLHEKEFSRTTFLKGGGAMLVGFSVAGASFGAKAAYAADDPYASNGPFDQTAVDSWLIIHADNSASLKIGKVEMGQGTPTALLIIAAEELSMDFKQMKMITHDTNVTPNQGSSVGSQGVQTGGKQTRAAAATAYTALLNMASANLGVSVDSLTVKSGVVSGGGKTVTYGQLIGDKLFNTAIPNMSTPGNLATPVQAVAGAPGTKPVSSYTVVGTSPPRVDIPTKVTGSYTYVHNIKLPGMLHGRVVRPRGQGAYGDGTAPAVLSVDESSISKIAGAKVVRSGNFLGVVAPLEYSAIQAAAQLKVTWAPMPPIRDVGNLFKGMRDDDTAGKVPARIAASSGNFDSAFAGAAQTLQRSYNYHYTGHLPIGPSCCVADVTPGGARIFTNTQDAYTTRGLVKSALDLVMGANTLPLNRIRLTYVEGSSVYGSSPYNDAAPGCSDHVGAHGQAGSAPVHALGRARLGQLRPGPDDGHPCGHRREWQHHRVRVHRVRDPVLDDAAGPAAGRRCAGVRDDGPAGHDDQRLAVQHPELARDRQEPAAPEQLLQGVVPAGAECAAVGVRRRAGCRRAGVHGQDGSGRVPPAEHRHHDEPGASTSRSGGRTCSPTWRRMRTGSRRWLRRTCLRPTSSAVAASRSGSTRTRCRAVSPTSR